jgi:heavy metal sensor kinase
MSLRSRIALYYTIATAILLGIVLSAIFFMLERVVYSHFDDELQRKTHEILEKSRGSMAVDISDGDDREDAEHPSRGDKHDEPEDEVDEFLQLVNKNGNIVAKSPNLGSDTLTFLPGTRAALFRNSKAGRSDVRQLQVPLTRENEAGGYLIAAAPVKEAVIILGDLKQVMQFSFPLVILTLFVLTRAIAGRSIRPVEEAIAAAEKISRANLDLRIPLPHHRDELFRLTSTINDLLDRLQDAFQRERQFTADASHELKTPLASIQGTLEVLVRKPREREHYEERIRFCLKELSRMAGLIDQLLVLARYESSGMTPRSEPVDLCVHVGEVARRMLPDARQKAISIGVNCPESVRVPADPAMLDMMLENLVSNALKYSPEGSRVAISVAADHGTVTCSVADNGTGIPAEKLNSIFERFYRVDESRSAETGGFGLGLAIVKKLAEVQHIAIGVTSRTGAGTTFELRFPDAGNPTGKF